MRIIKRNNKSFEKEMTCHWCKSIFAFTYNDIKYHMDIDGWKSPAVNCPCCGKYIDLEGCKDLPCKTVYTEVTDSEDK